MRIIDMHASLIADEDLSVYAHMKRGPGRGDPRECMIEPTLERLDRCGVEASVVWRIGRSSEECRRNNDFIAAAAAAHPDRFIPFATVYPHDVDEAVLELERAVKELGVAGVKIHPNVMDFPLDSDGARAVATRANELNIAFVTHVNTTLASELPSGESHGNPDLAAEYGKNPNSKPELLRSLAACYDSPRFQAAHMGAVTTDWVRDTSITFQTAGASLDVIQWALGVFGPDRIVFGSDFPFFLVEDELKKIERLDATDDAKEKILSGNALARVLPTRSPA